MFGCTKATSKVGTVVGTVVDSRTRWKSRQAGHKGCKERNVWLCDGKSTSLLHGR